MNYKKIMLHTNMYALVIGDETILKAAKAADLGCAGI